MNDQDGNPLTESVDDGNDGTLDAVYTWTYDSRGVLTMTLDENADGAVDVTGTWTYDANGSLVGYESHWGCGGAELTYDANGNVVTEELDSCDTTDSYAWTYDADNNMLTESDYGEIFAVYTYTFSAAPDVSECTRTAKRAEEWYRGEGY